MPWLNQFLLGRPGFEYAFDINPEALDIVEQPIDVITRNVAGHLKRSIIKTSAVSIKLSSSFLLKTQRDQFASLAGISDTFLSFKTRDDWKMLFERNLPVDANTVLVQQTSATKLSQALVAAGAAASITIDGVFLNPAGTGTNYFTGGSYNSANFTITLGTTLPTSTAPVFVNYTYTGWLVMMKSLNHKIQGGWVDRFQYDFELTGA